MKRLTLIALFLVACGGGTYELPNPDGGPPLGVCDDRWCTLYADGGRVGAP